jgi:hypothetical protein
VRFAFKLPFPIRTNSTLRTLFEERLTCDDVLSPIYIRYFHSIADEDISKGVDVIKSYHLTGNLGTKRE